ncbi:hypothetical protein BD626DRAFT_573462 [Schizophyllum amplum]|uniref:F-box domain-containing protein n=1 Tax=Schizophyllum amplum TaxID=97359 RepID=A0A550C1M3_9AGAR|nr:hypothetical protein BD626DRAFT_573462 [Auriculariopsis ampla]
MLPDCTGPWDMISGTFPLLEWFSVEGSEASESGGGRIDLTAAPKLAGLRIEMLPIGMDLRVPWEQLRTFEDSDSYASYEPLFVRLSRCRDLEELTIIADKAFFEDTPPPFTYTLPNLRKLDVSATLDEDFPCGILSALTAPRLESLAVTYWTEEQLQDFITETIKLLKRSSVPTLTSLDLSGPPAVAFSDDRMRVFLRDIPKLTSFTATGTFDKDFFDLLIEPKSEGLREFKFLPHLTELTLHAAEESNDAGIMDLLWARSLRPTTPRQNRLKSIEIWYVDKAWYDDDRVVLDERSQLVIACKGGELCYSSWCPFVL